MQETSIVIIVVMTFLFLNIKRIFVKRMHFRQAGAGRYTVKILIFSKLTRSRFVKVIHFKMKFSFEMSSEKPAIFPRETIGI